MRNLKNESKGITLVALVVTIIILLILARISIAQLTGSGLFEKAKLAKEKSENSQIEEEGKLGEYENELDKYLSNSRVDSNKGSELRKLGTLTGKGSETENYLELEECNEILVLIKNSGEDASVFTINIPYQELKDDVMFFRDGNGRISGLAEPQLVIVGCTSTKIWIDVGGYSSTNTTSIAKMSVYYR